jgi:integrase
MNLSTILSEYNGIPDTLNIPLILQLFKIKYPSISTRSKELSKFKRLLLEKTNINGFSSGYEYNVLMRKQKKSRDLLGKLNDIHLEQDEATLLLSNVVQRNKERVIYENVISKSLVESLINMIYSDNIIENMIGITICTGRRSTEVTKTGIFKKIQKNNHELTFQGILKNTLNISTSYKIPIIGNSSDILKVYRKVRKECDSTDLSIEQIIKLYGNRMLKHLKKLDTKLTVHSLRSIYISYLYQYMNPLHHSKTYMVEHFLCHESQGCTNHYNNWIILDN